MELENENNKQKNEIFITERTDITPLYWIDWLKAFTLTIGRNQLPENNQLEPAKVCNKISDTSENIESIKDNETNTKLKPEFYSVKQKAKLVSLHLQKNAGRELKKYHKQDIWKT